MMSSKQNLFAQHGLTATHNQRGFMHQLNEISQAFIDFAPYAPGQVVDMGAAFGVATIPILEKEIEVMACDAAASHLEELKNLVPHALQGFLKLKAGYFPNDFEFSENSIGAILFSQVLHFLSDTEMDVALQKLSAWLVPQGKVFIVVHTPYVAPMKNFLPIYEQRLAAGEKWPYWQQNNFRDYFQGPKEIKDKLPNTIHYLDLPQLTKALIENGFTIEKAAYLDPEKNAIPELARLDGREWCGVVAVRFK